MRALYFEGFAFIDRSCRVMEQVSAELRVSGETMNQAVHGWGAGR